MTNYIVEGNVNFFEELYKSLDEEETNGFTEGKEEEKDQYAMDTDLCLITNQPLENYSVKMKCGHKFNYLPLYKYLINYKQKFNSMESSKQKLDINEIRCPYCRTIHNKLIPYIEIEGVEKKHGINFFDENNEKYLHKFMCFCIIRVLSLLFFKLIIKA
jgi:hypothetical protein